MALRKLQAKKQSDKNPPYLLRMKVASRKSKRGWRNVGVGWENDTGGFRVHLDEGVVLDWRDFYHDNEHEADFVLILAPK